MRDLWGCVFLFFFLNEMQNSLPRNTKLCLKYFYTLKSSQICLLNSTIDENDFKLRDTLKTFMIKYVIDLNAET